MSGGIWATFIGLGLGETPADVGSDRCHGDPGRAADLVGLKLAEGDEFVALRYPAANQTKGDHRRDADGFQLGCRHRRSDLGPDLAADFGVGIRVAAIGFPVFVNVSLPKSPTSSGGKERR